MTAPDVNPVVVIDTREQCPLPITRFATVRAGLYSGDYSVRGLEHAFAIERKSLDDMAGSLVNSNRDRFERELHRLRGFRFARLLIVGTEADILAERYRSRIKPAAVMGSLAAFEVRYSVPVVFAGTAPDAARAVERWAHYFAREVVRDARNARNDRNNPRSE